MRYMVSKVAYKDKQGYKDNAERVRKCMQSALGSIADFATDAARYSVMGAVYDGKGTKTSNWVSQQIFMMDFDAEKGAQEITLEEIISIGEGAGAPPCVIQESASSSAANRKWHAFYALPEAVVKMAARDSIQAALMAAYEGYADEKCDDAARLFFPGQPAAYITEAARVDAEKLLKTYPAMPKQKSAKEKKAAPVSKEAATEMIDAIECGDAARHRAMLKAIFGNKASNGNALDAVEATEIRTIYNVLGEAQKNVNYCPDSYHFRKALTIDNSAFDSKNSFFGWLDMGAFLGLPVHEDISCILPDHEDNTPSAVIMTGYNGSHIYHCEGCGESMGIVRLVAAIQGSSVQCAADYICDVLELPRHVYSGTDQSKDIQSKAKAALGYLQSGKVRAKYEALFKGFKRGKYTQMLRELLVFAQTHSSDAICKDGSGAFFISVRHASRLLTAKLGSGFSRSSTGEKLNYLCSLGLLNKIAECDIDEHMLTHAKRLAAKYEEQGGYRQEYFKIPAYSSELFERAYEIAKENKKHGAKVKGRCWEQLKGLHGEAAADVVHPQNKGKKSRKMAVRIAQGCREAIEKLMAKQGYATEREIISALEAKYSYYEATAISAMVVKVLPGMMKDMDYAVARAGKETKATHGIETDMHHSCNIIVPAVPIAKVSAEPTVTTVSSPTTAKVMTFSQVLEMAAATMDRSKPNPFIKSRKLPAEEELLEAQAQREWELECIRAAQTPQAELEYMAVDNHKQEAEHEAQAAAEYAKYLAYLEEQADYMDMLAESEWERISREAV